jgi:predicted RNase H-like HicB family nuclease
MNYRVVLIESDEGFSVSCPALKGCHSQGATRVEALDNIRDAIREWLASESTENSLFTVTEEEVTV